MGSVEDISRDQDDRSLLFKSETAYATNNLKTLCPKNSESFVINETERLANLPVGSVEETHRVQHIWVEGSAKVVRQPSG
jgi:hypothetical protein